MTQAPTTPDHAAVCPFCGYDRTGATGERCTECGKIAGAGVRSRIPWAGRRYTGRVRAYLMTLLWVAFRPWRFAAETRWRISRRDAKSFHRVSILLATLLATGLFAVTFAFHGDWWNQLTPATVPDPFDFLESKPLMDALWTPMFVLWDSWLILIPVAVTCFLGFTASTVVYRWLLGLGEGDRFLRRRKRRMGLYFSAIGVWQALFLGLLLLVEMLLGESPRWIASGIRDLVVFPAQWILALCVGAVFLAPTAGVIIAAPGKRPRSLEAWLFCLGLTGVAFIPVEALNRGTDFSYGANDPWEPFRILRTAVWTAAAIAVAIGILLLILRTRRVNVARLWTMALVFPPIAMLAWVVLAAAIFWACGFLVIGIDSMLSR